MWLRLWDGKSTERLINTDFISLIEVSYIHRGERGEAQIATAVGQSDPDAVRRYTFRVDGEAMVVYGDSGDPICDALSDIYNKAMKA